jgi:thymidylate synthase (FAD)
MIEVRKIGEVPDIFGDGIAYVERWDFSKANMSHESRVNAITQIASVCYANPNAVNRETLYDRLASESMGLPSSSFEFVPMYFSQDDMHKYLLDDEQTSNTMPKVFKYGIFVEDGQGLITNYRAVLIDVEDGVLKKEALDHYNTEEECAFMSPFCLTYKTKIDIATARQFIRHRVSWQELSRRYVSGKKLAFEFYIDEEVKLAISPDALQNFLDTALSLYDMACANGCKAEQARRLIPVGMYTILWSSWAPHEFQNMINLRTDSHAQREIQHLANAMNLIRGN